MPWLIFFVFHLISVHRYPISLATSPILLGSVCIDVWQYTFWLKNVIEIKQFMACNTFIYRHFRCFYETVFPFCCGSLIDMKLKTFIQRQHNLTARYTNSTESNLFSFFSFDQSFDARPVKTFHFLLMFCCYSPYIGVCVCVHVFLCRVR